MKAEVHRLTNLLRIQTIRAERGLPTIETSKHLVFSGNPGTGKTTVARLLSEIFRTLGIVSRGHLVETDRSGLVAGYVGQTAARTRSVLESAIGGTLLIDEAYALARGGENDFGLEAIDTLVKFMEDHRDDLSVVAAGYPAEMHELVDANPGLHSRFTRTIHFPDYTGDELVAIFDLLSGKQAYHLDDDGRTRLREILDAEPRPGVRQRPPGAQHLRSRGGSSRASASPTSRRRPTSSSRRSRQPTSNPSGPRCDATPRTIDRACDEPARPLPDADDGAGDPVVADPDRRRRGRGDGRDRPPARRGRRRRRRALRCAGGDGDATRTTSTGDRRVRAERAVAPVRPGHAARHGQAARPSTATADGPLRERVAAVAAKLEHGLDETWRIARRGDEIDAAIRRLDPTALRSRLATLHELAASSERDAAITSVENQLASVDRMRQQSERTASTLRLSQTRYDELVSRAAEIAIGAGDTAAYEHDVEDLVIELEALRQAVEETRTA